MKLITEDTKGLVLIFAYDEEKKALYDKIAITDAILLHAVRKGCFKGLEIDLYKDDNRKDT